MKRLLHVLPRVIVQLLSRTILRVGKEGAGLIRGKTRKGGGGGGGVASWVIAWTEIGNDERSDKERDLPYVALKVLPRKSKKGEGETRDPKKKQAHSSL